MFGVAFSLLDLDVASSPLLFPFYRMPSNVCRDVAPTSYRCHNSLGVETPYERQRPTSDNTSVCSELLFLCLIQMRSLSFTDSILWKVLKCLPRCVTNLFTDPTIPLVLKLLIRDKDPFNSIYFNHKNTCTRIHGNIRTWC